MGIKVRVKRMSCRGSCLNHPILELKWSREERVYDLCEPDQEQDGQSGGYVCRESDLPVDAAWIGSGADNAVAVEQIALSPRDELYLESSTARLIDKTA